MTPVAPVPRAVLFDWGGTLTGAHDVDFRAEWVAFAQGYGTMACAQNELAGRLYTAAEEVWERSRQVPDHRAGSLAEVLAAVGLDPASGDPATEAALAAHREYWLPHTLTHPGAHGLLTDLRARGLRLGVLSNTLLSEDEHRGFLERDEVAGFFDAVLVSSQIGVAKPHPDAFEAAARAVGADPAECVYVGDRLYQDVFGAHAAGMRTILIDRGPGAALFAAAEHEPVEPDARVADLTEVADVLTGWGVAGSRDA